MCPSPAEPCRDAADLARLDGRRVSLQGTYLPVATPRKMRRPGGPRQVAHLGEVVIELTGSAVSYDPSAPAGAPARVALGAGPRPDHEISRLRHRRVIVEGLLAVQGVEGAGRAAPKPSPVLTDPTDPRPAD